MHKTDGGHVRRRPLLVAATTVAIVVLAGVVLMRQHEQALVPDSAEIAEVRSPAPPAGDSAAKDELAARPMPDLPPSYMEPRPLSTRVAGPVIETPAPRELGPAGVPTGYPRTPEGALAQLASIDQVAIEGGSIPAARTVIGAWAMPGGPTAATWSGVSLMAALLSRLQLTAEGDPALTIVMRPAMGMIKGTVGRDFVLVCVDFELALAYAAANGRFGIADCARMTWTRGRWMIGPGAEPAQPPSVWPGSEAAIDVGWRELRRG